MIPPIGSKWKCGSGWKGIVTILSTPHQGRLPHTSNTTRSVLLMRYTTGEGDTGHPRSEERNIAVSEAERLISTSYWTPAYVDLDVAEGL